METSILNSVKGALGLAADYKEFDGEILMHINTVFANLNQIGVGPEDGFYLESADTKWSAFLGTNKKLNAVPTFVSGKVRMIFDPPGTSFAISSMERVLEELEYRLYTTIQEEKLQAALLLEALVEDEDLGPYSYDPVTGSLWLRVAKGPIV